MYLVRRKRKDWKPKTKKEKNEQILEKAVGLIYRTSQVRLLRLAPMISAAFNSLSAQIK